jgi:hypothetical protein
MTDKTTITLEQAIIKDNARRENGTWYPACGGTELPFTSRSGARLQYMFQPSTRRHAYYNLDTDLFLTDAEADVEMAW